MLAPTLFAAPDARTLGQLVAEGVLTELSYMTADQAADALELEAFLTANADDDAAFARLSLFVAEVGA
jgi:hypothetical protein